MAKYKDNIPGIPGYHITKDGRLFNTRTGLERKCNPLHKTGYKSPKIRNKHYHIHRLVALVYIPNPNNLPVVMHLDDNKLNNDVSNLKWGTYYDNNLQSGMAFTSITSPSRKLAIAQVKEIRKIKKCTNEICLELAATYGVTRKTIYNILKYKTFTGI